MHDRQRCAVMYKMAVKFLNIVAPDWRVQLLSILTDGAQNMTWVQRGVVTRLCKDALKWVYRIWYIVNQLDLVMQHVLSDVLKYSFYSTLTGFILHLICQQKLVSDMDMTCLNFVNFWFLSHKVFNWFKLHHPELQGYIKHNRLASSSPAVQWCYLLAMQSFTAHSANTFHSIQWMTAMISQQVA